MQSLIVNIINKLILPLIAIVLLTGTVTAQRTDGSQLALERSLPGFGGMFLGEDGVLNVYFLGGKAPTNYLDVLKDYFRSNINPPTDEPLIAMGIKEAKILKGNYTFSQLENWKDILFADASLQQLGVHTADANEAKNLVTIAFEKLDKQKRGQIEERVNSLGVPLQAVEIIESQSIRQAGRGEPQEPQDIKSKNIIPLISIPAVIILLLVIFVGYKFYGKLFRS